MAGEFCAVEIEMHRDERSALHACSVPEHALLAPCLQAQNQIASLFLRLAQVATF